MESSQHLQSRVFAGFFVKFPGNSERDPFGRLGMRLQVLTEAVAFSKIEDNFERDLSLRAIYFRRISTFAHRSPPQSNVDCWLVFSLLVNEFILQTEQLKLQLAFFEPNLFRIHFHIFTLDRWPFPSNLE